MKRILLLNPGEHRAGFVQPESANYDYGRGYVAVLQRVALQVYRVVKPEEIDLLWDCPHSNVIICPLARTTEGKWRIGGAHPRSVVNYTTYQATMPAWIGRENSYGLREIFFFPWQSALYRVINESLLRDVTAGLVNYPLTLRLGHAAGLTEVDPYRYVSPSTKFVEEFEPYEPGHISPGSSSGGVYCNRAGVSTQGFMWNAFLESAPSYHDVHQQQSKIMTEAAIAIKIAKDRWISPAFTISLREQDVILEPSYYAEMPSDQEGTINSSLVRASDLTGSGYSLLLWS